MESVPSLYCVYMNNVAAGVVCEEYRVLARDAAVKQMGFSDSLEYLTSIPGWMSDNNKQEEERQRYKFTPVHPLQISDFYCYQLASFIEYFIGTNYPYFLFPTLDEVKKCDGYEKMRILDKCLCVDWNDEEGE